MRTRQCESDSLPHDSISMSQYIQIELVIHLTQVATTCSVFGYGDRGLSSHAGRVGASVPQRASLPGVSVCASLAKWVSLSPLRDGQSMASGFRTLAVRRLWPPDLGDGGNSFSGYEDAVDGVISSHVMDDESEERGAARWVFSRCLDGAATRRPGRVCISCGGR